MRAGLDNALVRVLLGLPIVLQVAACAGGIRPAVEVPTAQGNAAASVRARGWGLLPNGERDKYHWPLAATSLWNRAIGSRAVYRPARVVSTHTTFSIDPAILIMTPSAPLTTLYYNAAAWTGANRCPATSTVLASNLPIPADFVVPNSGDNNSTAIFAADGIHFDQNQPFTLCKAGGEPTSLVDFGLSSIYGDGIAGAHGGSGLSALGGVIRVGEFTSGAIHHPMEIELWAKRYYHCCKPIWPAIQVDGYAKSDYHGKLPYLGPGALMALPPHFNMAALQTTPAKILATALQNYGAYVVDDTFWNAWALTTEDGTGGSVAKEFHSLYGYDINESPSTSPYYRDIVTIFEALQVVTNNSATSIGGGGTPRRPNPPPIGN